MRGIYIVAAASDNCGNRARPRGILGTALMSRSPIRTVIIILCYMYLYVRIHLFIYIRVSKDRDAGTHEPFSGAIIRTDTCTQSVRLI